VHRIRQTTVRALQEQVVVIVEKAVGQHLDPNRSHATPSKRPNSIRSASQKNTV